MLTLRIIQPGRPDEVLTFERDYAVLGRKKEHGVDVVIDQPFVSGRHAIILKGTVVIDQGSSNGTFVDGQRIRVPALVRTAFTLGRDDVRIVVDEDEVSAEDRTQAPDARAHGSPPPALSAGVDPLAELRRRNAELEARIAQLESRMTDGRPSRVQPNPSDSRSDLEACVAEQSQTIQRLRAELDAARDGPPSSPG